MRRTFAALGERDFRIWTGAGFVSVTGTWMQALAVNWYILQVTGSATQMGLAVLLQALPVLLLSSWAGALADRLPARPLLICTQLAHAALAAGLAATAWAQVGGVSILYAVTLAGGLVTAVESPAKGRFGSTMVAPERLGNALSLGSLVNSAARIIGMSLGGLLVVVAGPAPLFAGNAASFLAVIVALLAVHERRPPARHAAEHEHEHGHGVRAGLRYLRRQPVILVTLGLAVVLGSTPSHVSVPSGALLEQVPDKHRRMDWTTARRLLEAGTPCHLTRSPPPMSSTPCTWRPAR